MLSYFQGDIVEVETDAIVNAANGIGYMGGWLGKKIKCAGVAEAIHYHTKGVVEKEAKKVVWKEIPKCGEVYVTSAGNLKATYILHAVTMYLPGTRSSLKTVEKCLISIVEQAKLLKVKKIAIPALGTGTGGLDKEKVAELYKKYLFNIVELEFVIVDPSGHFISLLK